MYITFVTVTLMGASLYEYLVLEALYFCSSSPRFTCLLPHQSTARMTRVGILYGISNIRAILRLLPLYFDI